MVLCSLWEVTELVYPQPPPPKKKGVNKWHSYLKKRKICIANTSPCKYILVTCMLSSFVRHTCSSIILLQEPGLTLTVPNTSISTSMITHFFACKRMRVFINVYLYFQAFLTEVTSKQNCLDELMTASQPLLRKNQPSISLNSQLADITDRYNALLQQLQVRATSVRDKHLGEN